MCGDSIKYTLTKKTRPQTNPEIIPAILRSTYEQIEVDWNLVYKAVGHIQIDVTDGVFAGDGTFREISRFRQLPESQKAELHLMVQTPGRYVDSVINLNPARCIFHIEAFAGQGDVRMAYTKLREKTNSELGLALNPTSPIERILEYANIIDYVLLMSYTPGRANQPANPLIYSRISQLKAHLPNMPIAVDGNVTFDTIKSFVEAGANILCSNTAIFAAGNPIENIRQLELLAQSALQA